MTETPSSGIVFKNMNIVVGEVGESRSGSVEDMLRTVLLVIAFIVVWFALIAMVPRFRAPT